MSDKKEFLTTAVIIFVFLALTASFAFSTDRILDPDQFYHFRHATLYKGGGLAVTDFPWTQFSIWKLYSADIWYGFHVLLIPFTYFADELLGMKFATIFLATVFLTAFYLVLRRHKIAHPFFWTAFLYFSAPDLLFRLNMSRPQILSFALLTLLLSFFIRGRWWPVFLLSAFLAFFHLSLFWTAILVGAIAALWVFVFEKKLEWQKLLAVIGGLIVGWLLRPNPIGALKILWVQLFELVFEKQSGVQLLFGSELLPLDWETIKFQLIPALILWLVAIIIFVWMARRERLKHADATTKIMLGASLSLSLVFLVLAFVIGRRASDLWGIYSILFAAQLFSWWLLYKSRGWLWLGLTTILLFMIARHSYIFSLYIQASNTYPPDHLKEASLWLKENSPPKEVVFHAAWDSFPFLFFWNQKNYYINGADPIFQYAFNKELYWKNHSIALSGKPYTCGSPPPCQPETSEDLYTVLSRDFSASFIVVELDRNSGLNQNLAKDKRFERVFQTGQEVVYKLTR